MDKQIEYCLEFIAQSLILLLCWLLACIFMPNNIVILSIIYIVYLVYILVINKLPVEYLFLKL